eukprot:6302477-Amphidinium_carterae.1
MQPVLDEYVPDIMRLKDALAMLAPGGVVDGTAEWLSLGLLTECAVAGMQKLDTRLVTRA